MKRKDSSVLLVGFGSINEDGLTLLIVSLTCVWLALHGSEITVVGENLKEVNSYIQTPFTPGINVIRFRFSTKRQV